MKNLKQTQKKVSDPIPSEILMDIFSRVPGKSIARFRCLSKYWRSTLGLPYFTELFLTKSLARPRLLFAIQVDKKLFLFSSPQPQNPADNSSLIATRYKCFPNYLPTRVNPPLRGLVLIRDRERNVCVICNPVTGESITLPKVKATSIERICLGYDPIKKHFKVFCTNRSRYGRRRYTLHRVLTLGTGKLKWRPTVECEAHGAACGEIGINGVFYYRANFEGSCCMMVSFDFTSEKFSFIKMHEEMCSLTGTLINHKGNLGVLVIHGHELVLWVLEEDAGKHQWCKRISVPSFTSFLSERIGNKFDIVGMTGAGEIVFSTYDQSNPFYIVYYNIEKNTFKTVQIMGFEEFQHRNFLVTTFLDYVENMKLL